MNDALKAFDVLDPTSEMSRFEEKVRREEARVIGWSAGAGSFLLDAQFNTLDQMERETELDARLAALKAKERSGAPAPTACGSSHPDSLSLGLSKPGLAHSFLS